MSRWIFCYLLFLATTSGAQPNASFDLKIIFGDKTSVFKIKPQKNGAHFSYSSNQDKSSQGELSAKTLSYLEKKISVIKKQKSNDPELCLRQRLELTQGALTQTGCIGSSTKISKDLTDLANALRLLL